MRLRHVIEPQQFNRATLEKLFMSADEMKRVRERGGSEMLKGKSMVTLFYEPSTRTRLSFEEAMWALGGRVLPVPDAANISSFQKGETYEDTVRVVPADVIVLRTKEEGAAARAAEVSPVPIINAGDGPGYHPTQAVLDVYTLRSELHTIDGVKAALVGDIQHGRAVRSFAYLLGKFEGVRISFVCGKGMEVHHDILRHLSEHKVSYTIEHDLARVASEVDVIYMTRLQKERIAGDTASFQAAYDTTVLTEEVVRRMRAHTIVMHPLPRINEIPKWFDTDHRAAYFRQSANGVSTRMALLAEILGSHGDAYRPEEVANTVQEAAKIL